MADPTHRRRDNPDETVTLTFECDRFVRVRYCDDATNFANIPPARFVELFEEMPE